MKKIALDAIDIRILSALQQHGKVSKSKLAELVNLSPTPCWVRLDKLKKSRLITGYRTDIDLDRLVDHTKVLVTISLKHHSKADFDRFESYILNVDAIIECDATGGGSDYVMKIIAKNLHDFQGLIEQLLNAEIGIDRYFIYIVTRQIKSVAPNLSTLINPSA
ncbi:MAG: Lrp/AsnC family transcriptional regulator of ectoine degradation [Oleispira sp.]|jgi:Lrp/AsnC family transcriptional regulator of ectoine degradation